MKTYQLEGKQAWHVLKGTTRSQAAEMVIEPGDSEGGPENKHPKSDQWLFVLEGHGTALVEGQEIALVAGTLLLIEKGERHQILSTGRTPLKTLNFYSPPAY